MVAFASLTTNCNFKELRVDGHNKGKTLGRQGRARRDPGGPGLRRRQQALAYLVRRSFVLGYALRILAALCGRQFCYPHLPISGTHGEGGVTTVGQELGLGC